jgi:phosphoribosylamine--glycine ligase
MKVLIIGNGGREHAIAWKIAQSASVNRVYVAPGNAGTAQEPGIENVSIGALDIETLKNFALRRSIDLTIVGPEAPLVAGIVDEFSKHGLIIFGPNRTAAQLEGSKSFTKDFLARHNIPTASYQIFSDVETASTYVRKTGVPTVIKADGLAAGKGVVLAQTEDEAQKAIRKMLAEQAFGEAGHRIIIEEQLHGEEASFICLVDGANILPLATSQDHKARDEGDTGPNTGGMGAYSPAPVVTHEMYDRIMQDIIYPTVQGLNAENNPYVGFLYAGLMITPDGTPKVLEYNCRLGDPETQPIMMRLKSDLVELCSAALMGKLNTVGVHWDPRPALGVVLASEGYPGDYNKGQIITGLHDLDSDDTKIYHAGTSQKGHDIVTNGGRVLCVTSLGQSIREARHRAYQVIGKIHWQGIYFRRDIGHRALARLQSPASESHPPVN